jgi:hypothetical protein
VRAIAARGGGNILSRRGIVGTFSPISRSRRPAYAGTANVPFEGFGRRDLYPHYARTAKRSRANLRFDARDHD